MHINYYIKLFIIVTDLHMNEVTDLSGLFIIFLISPMTSIS